MRIVVAEVLFEHLADIDAHLLRLSGPLLQQLFQLPVFALQPLIHSRKLLETCVFLIDKFVFGFEFGFVFQDLFLELLHSLVAVVELVLQHVVFLFEGWGLDVESVDASLLDSKVFFCRLDLFQLSFKAFPYSAGPLIVVFIVACQASRRV